MESSTKFIDYEYTAEGLQLNVLFGKAPKIKEEISKTPPNGFHTHFWYELFFAKDETLIFHTREKDITVLPEHFLLVHPSHPHYVTKNDPSPVFSFTVTAKTENYLKHPILEALKGRTTRIFKTDSTCNMLFSLLTSAFERENAREAASYMFGFLLHISDLQVVSEEKAVFDSDISRIFKIDLLITEYVLKNKPISLKELAKELNISTRQLARIFKKKYGCSFSEKITRLKMDKATRLLKEGRNITEVARESGYSSTKGFYSAFYNVYGLTPGEYKKAKEIKSDFI